jgi:hypothetical protein
MPAKFCSGFTSAENLKFQNFSAIYELFFHIGGHGKLYVFVIVITEVRTIKGELIKYSVSKAN